jgi:hypothetical protein
MLASGFSPGSAGGTGASGQSAGNSTMPKRGELGDGRFGTLGGGSGGCPCVLHKHGCPSLSLTSVLLPEQEMAFQ